MQKQHGALQIVVRGVRPLRLRLRELRDQKAFLAKRVSPLSALTPCRLTGRQVRRLERIQSDLVEMTQALTMEFTPAAPPLVPPPRRVSFRVAAIFVVALQRLRSFGLRQSALGTAARVGRDVLFVAPPARDASTSLGAARALARRRSSRADGLAELPPFGNTATPVGAADAFVALLRHFDPAGDAAVDGALPALTLDALARGHSARRPQRPVRAARMRGIT
jgi:hypothetical protein